MKYRIPIMHRTPFVRRIPVLEREPVIRRTSVFQRKAICSTVVDYRGCIIGDRYTDCNGCTYCKPGKENEYNDSILLVIDDEIEDWQEVIDDIIAAKNNKEYMRVVTDVPLPKEVIYELAYSPFNVLQYNLDLYMGKEELDTFKSSIFTASNCGLYIAVLLYPILPGVVRVYDVIELINSFRNLCRHVCLKFIEVKEPISPRNGYYNINGEAVPEWTLKRTEDETLQCSDLYISKFLTSLQKYIVPRKINVSICNQEVCY